VSVIANRLLAVWQSRLFEMKAWRLIGRGLPRPDESGLAMTAISLSIAQKRQKENPGVCCVRVPETIELFCCFGVLSFENFQEYFRHEFLSID
jgi:hypothetical protein